MFQFKYKAIAELSEKDVNRFWAKVAITANHKKCWKWLAGIKHKGYGGFRLHGKVHLRRIAYFLHYKTEPCDNPICVNPHHLKSGTYLDNIRDMDSKGRKMSLK